MNVQELITDVPKLHVSNGQLISNWKLADEELLLLDNHLTKGMKTIETGAGISTLVFAIKGTEHTCIVPDQALVNRIKSYCDEHGISYANTDFIIETSEYALPQLRKNFDLALIDGCHAFPTPFIDWFYLANLLKTGGILIVDDLHIWTCELLVQFLLSDEEWKLLEETIGAATFVKQDSKIQHKEWTDQVFVLRRSRQSSLSGKARYLLNLLKKRQLSLFWRILSSGVSSAISGERRR